MELQWNKRIEETSKMGFLMAPHQIAGGQDIDGISNSREVNSKLMKRFQGQRQTKTSSMQRNSETMLILGPF